MRNNIKEEIIYKNLPKKILIKNIDDNENEKNEEEEEKKIKKGKKEKNKE